MVSYLCSEESRQVTGAFSPVRTCVGCRRRESSVLLLRLVAMAVSDEVVVVPDVHRRLPGRGAWIHRDEACVQRAVARRAFGRALRVKGEVIDTQTISRVLFDSTGGTREGYDR